jgi:hypothetical protein
VRDNRAVSCKGLLLHVRLAFARWFLYLAQDSEMYRYVMCARMHVSMRSPDAITRVMCMKCFDLHTEIPRRQEPYIKPWMFFSGVKVLTLYHLRNPCGQGLAVENMLKISVFQLANSRLSKKDYAQIVDPALHRRHRSITGYQRI